MKATLILDRDPTKSFTVRLEKCSVDLIRTNLSMGLGTESIGNLVSARVCRRCGILPSDHVRFGHLRSVLLSV